MSNHSSFVRTASSADATLTGREPASKRWGWARRASSLVNARRLSGIRSTFSIVFKWITPYVKANLLLTHFGNLKWTHPHGGERESVFLRSERATPLICSAMAAQSVPSEEPGIKVAPLLFALLTPGSSVGWKNAPIAFSKKTTSCFSLKKSEESRKNTCYSAERVTALVVPPFVGTAAMRSFMRYDFPLIVRTSA